MNEQVPPIVTVAFGLLSAFVLVRAIKIKLPPYSESALPIDRLKRVIRFGGIGIGLTGVIASLKALADLFSTPR